jgi:hypothetical protein
MSTTKTRRTITVADEAVGASLVDTLEQLAEEIRNRMRRGRDADALVDQARRLEQVAACLRRYLNGEHPEPLSDDEGP